MAPMVGNSTTAAAVNDDPENTYTSDSGYTACECKSLINRAMADLDYRRIFGGTPSTKILAPLTLLCKYYRCAIHGLKNVEFLLAFDSRNTYCQLVGRVDRQSIVTRHIYEHDFVSRDLYLESHMIRVTSVDSRN